MAGNHLSNRDNWQSNASVVGSCGELSVGDVLTSLPDHIDVHTKQAPKIPVYSDGKGVVMDGVIFNDQDKTFTFVETKNGSAGTGNAHERAAKFLSNGLRSKMRESASNPKYLKTLSDWSGWDVTDYRPSEDLVFFFFTGITFENKKNIEELNILFEGYPVFNMSIDNPNKIAEKVKKRLDK